MMHNVTVVNKSQGPFGGPAFFLLKKNPVDGARHRSVNSTRRSSTELDRFLVPDSGPTELDRRIVPLDGARYWSVVY